jgi:NTE family protein
VVYLGGRDASPWARKAIRQADMVVFACRGDAPAVALTEIEAFACEVHSVSARRLVRIHDKRSGEVSGTAAWLARLPAFIHHVRLKTRSISTAWSVSVAGRSASSPPAAQFGTAHVRIYKAFRERGVMFDIFVGTNRFRHGGGTLNLEAEHLGAEREIFVKRSFRRPTWPLLLLDLRRSIALAHQYPDCRIELLAAFRAVAAIFRP